MLLIAQVKEKREHVRETAERVHAAKIANLLESQGPRLVCLSAPCADRSLSLNAASWLSLPITVCRRPWGLSLPPLPHCGPSAPGSSFACP